MNHAVLIAAGALFVGGGFVGALLAALRRRYYLVHLAIALYLTMALLSVLPAAWRADAATLLLAAAGTLVLLLMVGPSLVWAVDEWRDHRVPWRFALFAMAVCGLFVSMFLPLLAAAGVSVPGVTPAVAAVFTGPVARFAWVVAPLAVIVVVRRV